MKTLTKVAKAILKPQEKIKHVSTLYLGCDPEFFFLKNGRVIGSERVLSVDGEEYEGRWGRAGKMIIDGVQAEINPIPDTCRQTLSYRIGSAFEKTKELMEAHKDAKELEISIDPLVPITPAELGDLSDKAKFFGCTPSKNIYDEKNIMPIQDSSKYYFRSAGGHIHLGCSNVAEAHKNAENIVKMLDILVGNTCVLVDRHEGNVERRKLYGRAGEYRTPKHGIEYRTPSNFWLENYIMTSFVFGLARLSMRIMDSSNFKQAEYDENGNHNGEFKTLPDFAQEIFDAVDQEKIREAINNNDAVLAMENFKKIIPILERIVPSNMREYVLDVNSIPQFLHFVKKGKEYFFGKVSSSKVIANWIATIRNMGYGWEEFLARTVKADMEAEAKRASESKLIKRVINRKSA
jgi:hypothetical protein